MSSEMDLELTMPMTTNIIRPRSQKSRSFNNDKRPSCAMKDLSACRRGELSSLPRGTTGASSGLFPSSAE